MSVEVEQQTRVKLKAPQLYKVVLLNDDFTPMEFVVKILIEIFGKSPSESRAIMLRVHNEGSCVVLVTTKEIAEQKVREVQKVSLAFKHPLRCKTEPA
jgi:ATP-dependent Clp protease adaptor protein ClpS